MCIIIDPVTGKKVDVGATKLGYGEKGGVSWFAYMNIMKGLGTMLFAIRIEPGSEIDVTSSDSDDMHDFFKRLKKCFPESRCMERTLSVHSIGNYKVSVAKSGNDLKKRIDRKVFNVTDAALESVAAHYAPYTTDKGSVVFLVCTLVEELDKLSPIVIRYKTPADGLRIIPTFHGGSKHFGKAHDWDHVLYLQLNEKPKIKGVYAECPEPGKDVTRISPLGPDQPFFHTNNVWKMAMEGDFPNNDLAIDCNGRLGFLSEEMLDTIIEEVFTRPGSVAAPRVTVPATNQAGALGHWFQERELRPPNDIDHDEHRGGRVSRKDDRSANASPPKVRPVQTAWTRI